MLPWRKFSHNDKEIDNFYKANPRNRNVRSRKEMILQW